MTEPEWIAFLQRPEIPAFNRAMLENPDDDLPRLVFADWMDENCPDVEVNAAIRKSISGPQKGASWPNLRGNRKWNMSFVRGRVVTWINLELRPPQRRPPRKIFEAVWQAEWVESTLFGAVSGYVIEGWIYDPPMKGVRALGLNGSRLQGLSLARWLSPKLAERLSSLAIYGPCPDIGWLSELAVSPNITRLTSLTLTACQIGDEGVLALATSPYLANLTHLRFEGNTISPVGAAALANSPYLCEAIRAQWRRPTNDSEA